MRQHELPRRLAYRLREAGDDAVHTLDLPGGNGTDDDDICSISTREHRVAITKDADFVNTFLLARRPYKLLLISPSMRRLSGTPVFGGTPVPVQTLIDYLEAGDSLDVLLAGPHPRQLSRPARPLARLRSRP